MTFPNKIYSGLFPGGHCQGIALDMERGWVYFSFTTMLVKTDLAGNLLGSVTGLLGHLGCIGFCPRDGRVYGSLEYKNDAIGREILERAGKASIEDAFYAAIFDGEKITRPGMDACADGVMKTVFLSEVGQDYRARVRCGGEVFPHRHGCSGIDGLSFGRIPGGGPEEYLFVCYGIYSDLQRRDNDYQVILCYDTRNWAGFETPLRQEAMHRSGPEKPLHKFFLYTGNTTYGVQNLEYDRATGNFFLAVYCGQKPEFPNHPMYIIDGQSPPVRQLLRGVEPETEAEVLTLLPSGRAGEQTPGLSFPYGSTGLFSLGDGRFYVSQDGNQGELFYTNLHLYRWDGRSFLPCL